MSVAALELIQNALAEIGVYSPGETLSAADAQFCLKKLNRMLDQWNATVLKIYNRTFQVFNMVTGLPAQPFTIGPTGLFVVSQRPEKILAANIFLNQNGSIVRSPVAVRDDDWWAAQRVPQITSSLPTDLYYSAQWPNGQIFVWPVPTVVRPLELELWGLLTQVTNLVFQINVPPAYENLMTYHLAIDAAAAFRKEVPDSLALMAQRAETAVEVMNSVAPRMGTSDSGMPLARRNRSTFNYHTGMNTGSR
jgi:hypothetical protein